MADSTMSDADKVREATPAPDAHLADISKIRAKRLAKLGGAQSNGSSSASLAPNGTATQSSAATPQSTATSPPPQQSTKAPTEPKPSQFSQLGMKQEQEKKAATPIKVRPRPASPAKRNSDGAERPRSQREPENLETWQDRNLRSIFRVTLRPEEVKDAHGHPLLFLGSTRQDLNDENAPFLLNNTVLEGAITEAASQAPGGKPFEYLLACFKRISRGIRGTKYSGADDPKRDILKETRRLCMSYCVFAVTMPEMFGENVPSTNPLVDHLLSDPECDSGICTDFLDEASTRMDEDESISTALVGAAEDLSRRLATVDMNGDYQSYVRGLMNLIRYPKIVEAITHSSMWAPADVEPQDIETKTLLGPFFRLSPMQLEVAQSYFSAPRTRDRNFITSAQNAVRLTLRNHQLLLFQIARSIAGSNAQCKEAMLDWFALCVNKNHKKRAMRVDYKTVSGDGFMVNVTVVLDQLCEPFMDASFSKIDKIDVDYLRRKPRVDISDETKINADQKAADEFYARPAEGTSGFTSEIFFLTVAAHHYGTEAAQTRMATMKKSVKRYEQDLETFEADRHKYLNDPRYLARFEEHVSKIKQQVDDMHSTIHATNGVLLDDLNQARSMQFMRLVIVWLLRLASRQNLPKSGELHLPLPADQPDVFRCLPEYFLEDIVENFKFITRNIPHIMTPQQCDEIIQICVAFLRNTEYVKNPGVKSGLVTILFFGVQPMHNSKTGMLGDLLIGSPFAHKHLLHALMRFYIEAESTGTHTQFYDKFNIRFEIFQVIKCIWANTMYRENLAREAAINTDFFVQFVNMIVNDVTFVLDESLSSFTKIHELTKELASAAFSALSEDERKEKTELLEDQKGKAKSYMGLTRESMETLILFTETLPEAFTMPEIVQRLADMLDYNLDIMVGDKRTNLRVDNADEYKFNPRALLTDIVKVFINLSGRARFVQAIAKDGRSYKPDNFTKAADLMRNKVYMSPLEIQTWTQLGDRVALVKAEEEEEEADLGEPPEEFMDPLMADLMTDPVILPISRQVVDRSTIRSHLLSDPNDPFNRTPLKIADVLPDDELRGRIQAWRAERLAVKRAEKEGGGGGGGGVAAVGGGGGGEAMDTSQG
ncbi:hypothetical protein LTR36_005174 [Oleoguttula mirabilis]|uniref:U-box domain-containing protein n=1 Tax=Oleoguttula mirabilis TaxID=1507867 RepID=A0AAV9JXS0_9PEZI|nr:hypothetical protein LTR36_005174 [Oleoguttula mirabilis]